MTDFQPETDAPSAVLDGEAVKRLVRRAANRDAFGPVRMKGERLEEWMLTYMDTVTLLVTLFVLILSFSSIEDEKFKALVEGLRLDKYSVGVLTGSQGLMDLPSMKQAPVTTESPPAPEQDSDIGVSERLGDLIAEKGLDDQVEIKFSKDLIDLQLQEGVLFPSGTAELLGGGKRVLHDLMPLLAAGDYPISVQGHTDSVPIATEQFPSNWELSGARAASVVRELIVLGVEEKRLELSGFAHTHPLGDNGTASGRERNRRVNILLHASRKDMEDILLELSR